MRASIMSAVAIGAAFACGAAAAQPAAPGYQSPITILSSEIVYTVNADGTYVRDETARIRVNTAQAVQSQAQTYLPHSESMQRIEVLEAYTQTADGQRVDVTADKIITQQSPASTNAPAFNDVKITSIVFPQIAPGAVKAFRFRITQTKPLFAEQFSMVEQFASIVDIDAVSLTLVAPESLEMRVEAIGLTGGPVAADERRQAKWVWKLAGAKGAAPEPGSVSTMDFSPRVAATTFADFEAAAEAYLDGAADKAKVTSSVRARADAITAGISDPRQQARALYHWVAANIRYVALGFGQGGVVPRAADAILESGYGDCKDNVVLLGALLAAKGIESAPVLVNAQNVFWQPKVAVVPGVYNHAITYVPDLDLYLDSTAQLAPFGVLPVSALGKSALVTRGLDSGAGLVTLPVASPRTSTAEVVSTMTVGATGSVQGEGTMRATGPLEFVTRAAFATIPPGQESQVANNLMAAFGQLGSGTFAAGDPRRLAEDFSIRSTFTINDAMVLPGPAALTVPLGVPGPTAIASLAREVALPVRAQSLSCTAFDKVETTSLTLPSSVAVKQLPPPVAVENPLGSYRATYTQQGATVNVRRQLTLAPSSAVCTPADYQRIRELGQAVARDMRAQILY